MSDSLIFLMDLGLSKTQRVGATSPKNRTRALSRCCLISFSETHRFFLSEAATAGFTFTQQFGNSCLFCSGSKQLYLTPCEATAREDRHSIVFVCKWHSTEVLPSCIYQLFVRNTWQWERHRFAVLNSLNKII